MEIDRPNLPAGVIKCGKSVGKFGKYGETGNKIVKKLSGWSDQVWHPALCSQQRVHLLGHLHITSGILLKKWNNLKL